MESDHLYSSPPLTPPKPVRLKLGSVTRSADSDREAGPPRAIEVRGGVVVREWSEGEPARHENGLAEIERLNAKIERLKDFVRRVAEITQCNRGSFPCVSMCLSCHARVLIDG